jgi:hypothetical protein
MCRWPAPSWVQVRLLTSKLTVEELLPVKDKLADALFTSEAVATLCKALWLASAACVQGPQELAHSHADALVAAPNP